MIMCRDRPQSSHPKKLEATPHRHYTATNAKPIKYFLQADTICIRGLEITSTCPFFNWSVGCGVIVRTVNFSRTITRDIRFFTCIWLDTTRARLDSTGARLDSTRAQLDSTLKYCSHNKVYMTKKILPGVRKEGVVVW